METMVIGFEGGELRVDTHKPDVVIFKINRGGKETIEIMGDVVNAEILSGRNRAEFVFTTARGAENCCLSHGWTWE